MFVTIFIYIQIKVFVSGVKNKITTNETTPNSKKESFLARDEGNVSVLQVSRFVYKDGRCKC